MLPTINIQNSLNIYIINIIKDWNIVYLCVIDFCYCPVAIFPSFQNQKTRKKVAEWREKQEDKKDVTSYVPVSNPPKVKERKVKESNKEELFKIEVENFKNYASYLLKEFFEYWSETNKSGSKMRFELEKTWDLKRRLARWSSNSKLKTPVSDKVKKQNTDEVERMLSENYKDTKYIGRPK